MRDPIAFYFDFMSPYAYIGSVGIEQVAARHGREVDWRPILLGITVNKVMGLKGVADTPLKRDYVRRDLPRLAHYLGVPFHRAKDTPMSPLPAARAFLWLKDCDPVLGKAFGQAVFRAQWAQARDMSTASDLASLGRSMGIDSTALIAATESEAIKQRLKDEVSAAIDVGVFGAPTFVIDGEMFWGADRLAMVEHWIETGGW